MAHLCLSPSGWCRCELAEKRCRCRPAVSTINGKTKHFIMAAVPVHTCSYWSLS